MSNTEPVSDTQGRYLAAAVMGEVDRAQAIVQQAINRGARPTEIYLDVLAPSQAKLGELWLQGTINIAQEHVATSITMQILDLQRAKVQSQTPLGRKALVMPVEGDQHFVGARMIADALMIDGWDVEFFWNSTPAKDLVEYVQQSRIHLIALSATMPEYLPNVKTATEALKSLNSHRPKIILGGPALANSNQQPHLWGVDAISNNLIDAIDVSRRLVGLTSPKPSLEEQLLSMGQIIKKARSRRKLTQQQLADASGLDRTYISLVEHGKQNITVGAILKIADALDIPFNHLFEPSYSS